MACVWGERIDGWPIEKKMACLIHGEERAPRPDELKPKGRKDWKQILLES